VDQREGCGGERSDVCVRCVRAGKHEVMSQPKARSQSATHKDRPFLLALKGEGRNGREERHQREQVCIRSG